MYYSLLSHKMISFVLFPQASQPSMNFNISESVYFFVSMIPFLTQLFKLSCLHLFVFHWLNKVLNVVYSYFFLQLFVKPNLFLSILFVVTINRTQWSSNLSPSHSNFPFGIISGRHWGSFTVEDHLRSILGIICGWGSFAGAPNEDIVQNHLT